MDRKIKFRAWDEDRNRWLNCNEICEREFNPTQDRYAKGFVTFDLNNSFLLQGITLEQFTGLLDKNGKEIYEGDIVRFYFSHFPRDHETEMLDEVYFENGAFLLRNIEDPCYTACPLVLWARHCKIIGNIHENPELLTKE